MVALLVAAVAFFAAACSGDDGSDALTSAVGEPQAAAAASVATAEPTPTQAPTPRATPEPTPTEAPTPVPTAAPTPPPPPPQPAQAQAVVPAVRDARTVAPLEPLPRVAGSRVLTVVIDPGHGADEVGAAAHGVVEKDSNLEFAFRVERLLAAQGVRVVLTRRADARANAGPALAGFSAQRRDLQARVDLANDLGAELFVSVHSNGALSAGERGVEVYYNSQRPHSDWNRTLAQLLLDGVIAELHGAGYPVLNRGAKDDSCLRAFQGRCFPLFLLGPERVTTLDEVLRRGGTPEALGFVPGQDAIRSRATQMPAALVELLFVSNANDAAILRAEDAREAMARGVARGVLQFLARRGGG